MILNYIQIGKYIEGDWWKDREGKSTHYHLILSRRRALTF